MIKQTTPSEYNEFVIAVGANTFHVPLGEVVEFVEDIPSYKIGKECLFEATNGKSAAVWIWVDTVFIVLTLKAHSSISHTEFENI